MNDIGKRGSGLLLATIAMSMFLDGLDGTIVNVALPSIASSFDIGTGDTSWIITIYYLMMAGLILVFGRLCDLGALKKILIIGMTVFTLGSLFCGLSPNFELLLISRGFQGVGAAILAASSVMLGVKYLPREKLALGMSLVIVGMSLGTAVGPSLGAVMTEYFSWHWIFFINVPVGFVAILMAYRAIPTDKGLEKGDIDLPGSIMLFAAIVLGLYAVERVPSIGLTMSGIVSIVGCIAIFSVFMLYERGRTSPVLNLNLFRNLDFDSATIAYGLINLGYMGMFYLLPFLLRSVYGMDILTSGLYLSVISISMVTLSIVVGRLSEKRGERVFAIISCSLLAIFMLALSLIGTDTPLFIIAICLLVLGAVWGIGGGPMGARMVNTLDDEDRGSGSSMVSFIMYACSALGTALFAGLFGFGTGEGSGSIDTIPPTLFMEGFNFCAVIGLIMSLVAIYLSWRLRSDVRT